MVNNALTVADDLVVSLHYTLRLDDGEIIDASESGEPLEFLQGHGQIIPGLERELAGMTVGEEKNVVVTAADGYGESDPDQMQLVPRDIFPEDMDIEIDNVLGMRDANTGQTIQATVAEIRPDGVMLDLNHPLAGETLYFHVKVADLRQATAEEMDHGHAH